MKPVDLISALADLGYSVTPPRLTDWRSKGLLPPLRQRGRGQHRVATYSWSEPEVLDHAATLCGLLSLNSRTEPALVALWLAGFRVDVALVRGAWLGSLTDQKISLDQFADRTGGMEPAHSQWASKFARAQANKLGLDRASLTEILLEILSTIFESDYEPSLELYEDDFRSAAAVIARTDIAELRFVDEANLRSAARVLQRTLTHEAVYRLIQSASAAELEQACQQWQSLGRILSPIVRRDAPHLLRVGLSPAKQFAIAFGRAGILLLLHLRRSIFGSAFADALLGLEAFIGRNKGLILLLGNQNPSTVGFWSAPELAGFLQTVSEIGAAVARSISPSFE